MKSGWHKRVSSYVDQLEEIAKTIDSALEQTALETNQVSAAEVEKSMSPLTEALAGLEEKIAQREELLAAPDAPRDGLGLIQKLQSTDDPDDAILAGRCEKVASLMTDANRRAVSLFVCQFHLAEFSADIVRLIFGGDLPATYAASDRERAPARGSLFNESA